MKDGLHPSHTRSGTLYAGHQPSLRKTSGEHLNPALCVVQRHHHTVKDRYLENATSSECAANTTR